jgi:hypothetical protein
LLVPGTVAAFQREGTGGFVLSLSATQTPTEYAIDPRFPLFQQRLANPKQSHIALAELLGIAGDVFLGRDPMPSEFTDQMLRRAAKGWVDFNLGYADAAGAKFAKYAAKLNENVVHGNAQGPKFVLAPYFIASGLDDEWWERGSQLFAFTRELCSGDQCVRVVAASTTVALSKLLDDIDDEHVAIWVSGLNELETTSQRLALYAQTIRNAREAGTKTFALYGGFFSVLLGSFGLSGSSHGIGYGEYRSWLELPQSGPPPARYYLPRAHRYVSQELAHQMWLADRDLAACGCEDCEGESPIFLEYQALMRHSVRRRAIEVAEWAGLEPGDCFDRLRREHASYTRDLEGVDLPQFWRRAADRTADAMDSWVLALDLAR